MGVITIRSEARILLLDVLCRRLANVAIARTTTRGICGASLGRRTARGGLWCGAERGLLRFVDDGLDDGCPVETHVPAEGHVACVALCESTVGETRETEKETGRQTERERERERITLMHASWESVRGRDAAHTRHEARGREREKEREGEKEKRERAQTRTQNNHPHVNIREQQRGTSPLT